MTCQRCESDRITFISAKCSDMCYVNINQEENDGNVPYDMGIGGGDFIKFDYCLECGQIQGEFPLDVTDIERDDDLEEYL